MCINAPHLPIHFILADFHVLVGHGGISCIVKIGAFSLEIWFKKNSLHVNIHTRTLNGADTRPFGSGIKKPSLCMEKSSVLENG